MVPSGEQREALLDFGKHKGRQVTQLDDGYLRWLIKSLPDSSHWHKAAADTLAAKPRGVAHNAHALLSDLKACTVKRDLQWGRGIHAKALECKDYYVATALMKMYAKCGSMGEAHQVFDDIWNPDVVSWTALILGYAENGQGHVSLELFSKMKAAGCIPNSITYVAALKACASLRKLQGLERGREIHLEIADNLDIYVQSTLVDMYAKCGSMVEARHVFDSIQNPNVVSWTALLLGYAENGEGQVALDLLSDMKASGCAPNSVTYVAALKACTSLAMNRTPGILQRGREIHLEIGDHLSPSVQSTLIGMYAKCGSMLDAHQVFQNIPKPDVVSWTALLLGYAENGEGHAALDLFSRMKADSCVPDSVTYVAALKACSSLKVQGLKVGRSIHFEIDGCCLNLHVQNTLIDMYAKCGSMVEALRAFQSIEKPDVVSWNALLLGYEENGEPHVVLKLFSKMKADGCAPDAITLVAALRACTFLAANGDGTSALEWGREIHMEIGDHMDPYLQSALIDLYSKCGVMTCARQVFDSIHKPDVVSWTSLLLGYAENGEGRVCLELFSKMKADRCVPDTVTYVAVLKACGSVGALALGRKFHSEITEYTVHVVTCLVDFYGRCGSMVEAQAVFELHPRVRDVTTWNALLAGYSSCGDTGAVFNLFEAMQDMVFRPDSVTLLCVLLCCSHAGLVGKARYYLGEMPVRYGIAPHIYHFNCMVDVLARANRLNEAISVLREMPCVPNVVTWSALLGACRKWKNVGIGTMAFQSLVELQTKDASAYVLMTDIYGSRGEDLENRACIARHGWAL